MYKGTRTRVKSTRKRIKEEGKGKITIKIRIKKISWEYSCVEEYLIEFYKKKILRYFYLYSNEILILLSKSFPK